MCSPYRMVLAYKMRVTGVLDFVDVEQQRFDRTYVVFGRPLGWFVETGVYEALAGAEAA